MALINIDILSVYKKNGQQVLLPKSMARCTPDMKVAIEKISADLVAQGGRLVLSDLFRSYDMQLQSYLDFKNGKKSAYSPPPGGSMHEAGRAMDLDLDRLGMSLAEFWNIAKAAGLSPIISQPDSGAKEAWHFDCRGSHDIVYKYYSAGKANNMKPYQAMAASAILSQGIKVDRFENHLDDAAVQCALVRLGFELGNIDGSIGQKTRTALDNAHVQFADPKTMLATLQAQLQQKFPGEFDSTVDHFEDTPPDNVNP